MSLSSLPTALLLPPVNLVPIGIAGIAMAFGLPGRLRRARLLGRWLAIASLASLLLLSLPVVGDLLVASLEIGLPYVDLAAADGSDDVQAIVILGGDGSNSAKGGIVSGPSVGALTLERIRAGAILYRRTGLPVLVSGGPLQPQGPPIAGLMAGVLQSEFAVPVTWVEARSIDTWQNAQFSAAILRALGIRRVYVVTHGWHMRRALMAFDHAGLQAVPAPLRRDAPYENEFDAFVPHVSAWLNSYWALHEWIGCAYYALRR